MESKFDSLTPEEKEQLVKRVLEVSWASCMAYTRACEQEDRIARMERIEKGMQEVDRMAAVSLVRLQGRVLD